VGREEFGWLPSELKIGVFVRVVLLPPAHAPPALTRLPPGLVLVLVPTGTRARLDSSLLPLDITGFAPFPTAHAPLGNPTSRCMLAPISHVFSR
jgi:hypothetical protein